MKTVKRKTFYRGLLLFFGGMLGALPVVFSPFSLSVFVVLSPFCYYLLKKMREGCRLLALYLSCLIYFQGYFMLAFSFFTSMYPLDFAGLSKIASLAVVLVAMVLLPFALSSIFSLMGVALGLFARFVPRGIPLLHALALASLWTVFSYVQNLGWFGVPFAPISLALTPHPVLIQSASLFGHYFLIFLIVLCNSLLAEAVFYLRRCQDKGALLSLCLILGILLGQFSFGALRLSLTPSREEVKIAVLQGNVSSMEADISQSENMLFRFASQARKAANADDGIDLMLWAEAAYLGTMEDAAYVQAYLGALAKETGTIQVVGSYGLHPDSQGEERFYNSLFVFYPDGSMSQEVYDKRRPVPFGEYLPWTSFFKAVIPPLAEINMLSRDIQAGETPSLFSLPFGKAGGLICFDSLYPALSRESAREGAEIFLLATNDSWFDGSFAKDVHFAHAIMRSVECGRATARAGNTGISGFIDAYGRTKARTLPDIQAHLIDTLPLSNTQTVYTRIGDCFVLLALLYSLSLPLCFFLTSKYKNKRRKPQKKGTLV
ncbi:MAG: apolipoprotein N-acyltransferase [Clostridia bacterium]|nr:apolipoprotein N-acyltransferase [Clostridia bacterium]